MPRTNFWYKRDTSAGGSQMGPCWSWVGHGHEHGLTLCLDALHDPAGCVTNYFCEHAAPLEKKKEPVRQNTFWEFSSSRSDCLPKYPSGAM